MKVYVVINSVVSNDYVKNNLICLGTFTDYEKARKCYFDAVTRHKDEVHSELLLYGCSYDIVDGREVSFRFNNDHGTIIEVRIEESEVK